MPHQGGVLLLTKSAETEALLSVSGWLALGF